MFDSNGCICGNISSIATIKSSEHDDGELVSCKSRYAFSVSLMSINANRTRLIDAENM